MHLLYFVPIFGAYNLKSLLTKVLKVYIKNQVLLG